MSFNLYSMHIHHFVKFNMIVIVYVIIVMPLAKKMHKISWLYPIVVISFVQTADYRNFSLN